MGLGIKYPVVQADQLRLREYEVKILQRLTKPETFHRVRLAWLFAMFGIHIPYRGIGQLCVCQLINGVPHAPCRVLPCGISRNAIHDKNALNRFGAEDISRIGDLGE